MRLDWFKTLNQNSCCIVRGTNEVTHKYYTKWTILELSKYNNNYYSDNNNNNHNTPLCITGNIYVRIIIATYYHLYKHFFINTDTSPIVNCKSICLFVLFLDIDVREQTVCGRGFFYSQTKQQRSNDKSEECTLPMADWLRHGLGSVEYYWADLYVRIL